MRGHRERGDDARDIGVDAALQQTVPQGHAEGGVNSHVGDFLFARDEERRRGRRRARYVRHRQRFREAHGDHGDRAQVVHGGEGEQKRRHAARHFIFKKVVHSHGERDVRRHRNRPTRRHRRRRRARIITRQIHPHGHQHPAQRADARQRRLLQASQRAVHELALDLQPDGEEENRHQPLVDPVMQAHVQRQRRRPDFCVPERQIRPRHRAVRQRQRHRGGSEERDRAEARVERRVHVDALHERPLLALRPVRRRACRDARPDARGFFHASRRDARDARERRPRAHRRFPRRSRH